MSSRFAGRTRPELALNAIRLALPEQSIPAAVIPFERSALHGFLDRPKADVFAIRHGDTEMAIIPVLPDADLPAKAIPLAAADNLRLFATLAREAVFRHLLHLPGNYRIVRRRPPEVETAKQENIIPGSRGSVGLRPRGLTGGSSGSMSANSSSDRSRA